MGIKTQRKVICPIGERLCENHSCMFLQKYLINPSEKLFIITDQPAAIKFVLIKNLNCLVISCLCSEILTTKNCKLSITSTDTVIDSVIEANMDAVKETDMDTMIEARMDAVI